MSAGKVFAGVVAGILIASIASCGGGSDDQSKPETRTVTRIVSVPTIKTHVIEKKVATPLPQSCTHMIEMYAKLAKTDGEIVGATGRIQDALDELGRATQSAQVVDVNAATQVLIVQRRILNTAAAERAEIIDTTNYQLTVCQQDTKESK